MLGRLQSKSALVNPKQTLTAIMHTNRLEMEISAGTSYRDCFNGTERRRTEIACLVFAGEFLAQASLILYINSV